ncbi:zinc ribbon domain-containing protein [uncultured Methanobrevibacter sp.]|uniref:zinc ribbon domain-containing protein n=1 Tax=uncultured Methanobrevibacter sp. TaxID=253161 RepID=UPI0025F84064|nr:zinc ribbon domain-containing protein [uncultured Methanobrevibacter sp.]
MVTFKNDKISFDYPEGYVENTTDEHRELDIIASFEKRTLLGLISVFAVFNEIFITDRIPNSKFEEVIKEDGDSILDIHRYSFEEKERIIIKTKDDASGNIRYRCNIPELGFSVLFIVFNGKEKLFIEDDIYTILNSIKSFKSRGMGLKSKDSLDSKFCSKCGSRIDSGAKFCQTCGNPIKN